MAHGDFKDKYIFAIDDEGFIVTRNPANGKQALIEVKAGVSGDAVVYHDLDGDYASVSWVIHFKKTSASPSTDVTDVPLWEFGPSSLTAGDVTDAATSGANSDFGDGTSATVTLTMDGGKVKISNLSSVLSNWSGTTGPQGRYYHSGALAPPVGHIRVWDSKQQVAVENKSNGAGGILGEWVSYTSSSYYTPQDTHNWIRNAGTNTDGAYWSQYCQQFFTVNFGNVSGAQVPDAGDAFQPASANNKYVIAAREIITAAPNLTCRFWVWNYGSNFAGGANLGSGLGSSPDQNELQSWGSPKVKFYEYDSSTESYSSTATTVNSINNFDVGDSQFLLDDATPGQSVKVLKLFKNGTDEYSKGQIGKTVPQQWKTGSSDNRFNIPNLLVNTDTAPTGTANRSMQPMHSNSAVGFANDYQINNTTGLYSGSVNVNDGNKNSVLPIAQVYGTGATTSALDFIDLDTSSMSATQPATRRSYNQPGGDYVVRAEGTTAFNSSRWNQWNGNASHTRVTLAGQRTWGWAYSTHGNIPSPNVTITTPTDTTSCGASFTVTSMGGHSSLKAVLHDTSGNNWTTPSGGITISGTGSYTIPINTNAGHSGSPNRNYVVKILNTSNTTLLTSAQFAISSCPYFNIAYTQNGCVLNVTFTNIGGGYSSNIPATFKGRLNYGTGQTGYISSTGSGSTKTISFNIPSVIPEAKQCLSSFTFELQGTTDSGGSYATINPGSAHFQSGSGNTPNWSFAGVNQQCPPTLSASDNGNCGFTINMAAPSCWATAKIQAKVFLAGTATLVATSSDITSAPSTTIVSSGLQPSTNYDIKYFLIQDQDGSSGSPLPIEYTTLAQTSLQVTGCLSIGNFSPTVNACGVNVAIASTGYSASDLRIKLLKEADGSYSQIGSLITPSTVNGTHSIDLSSSGLGHLNGNYKVQLLAHPSGNVLSSPSTVLAVTLSSCQTITHSVAANSCGLNVTISSAGYQNSDLTLKLYKSATSSGTYNLVSTIPSPNANGVTAIPLNVAPRCNGYYKVEVHSGGQSISPKGNPSAQPTSGQQITACSEGVTVATPAQSNCTITGKVESVSCLPENSSGNVVVRATLKKSSDNSTVGTAVTITKSSLGQWESDTASSSTVDFLFNHSSIINTDYYIVWEYQNASNNFVSAASNQNVTSNTCKTFSGAAAPSTSPKCGIAITVNWGSVANLGSTIRAIVFLDTNGNGALDGGEAVITGATVGGSAVDFSSTGVNFTAGSGNETKTVVLDALSDPNAKYIVEFQADPDGDSTFSPVDTLSTLISSADVHKAVEVTNCTPCANNATPFYYFQVSGGNIVTNNGTARGITNCATGVVTPFSGGYCKTDASSSNWVIIGKAGGGQWASSDVASCTDGPGQADGQSITVRLSGSHLQTGQPLSVFTSGSSWTTPLADGYYIACNTTFPNSDANPCSSTTYGFQVDGNGKIVTTSGGKAAADSALFNGSASYSVFGSTGVCFDGTSYAIEGSGSTPTNHGNIEKARDSIGCGYAPSDTSRAGVTVFLFGNTTGDLFVHTANDNTSSKLGAGFYSSCAAPPNGTVPCASDEHFINISTANGDWNGILYNSSGGVDATWATDSDWFDESQITGWTGSGVGAGWASLADAKDKCANEYVNVDSDNIIVVSGTLTNYTTESDRLRIYRGPGETNPLAAGWYRYCGQPTAPDKNGVPEYRKKFDCYGNPFSWWSAKPRDAFILDSNNLLTNGVEGETWWRNGPVKDLTDTNNDLGIYGFTDIGDVGQEATILRTTVSRSCISNHQNGGGASQNKDVLQFTAANKKNLTRAPNRYHPDANFGIPIISSVKTSATEMTIAVVFDSSSTSGMILQLSDIVVSAGDNIGEKVGDWDRLQELAQSGNTITESVVEFKKSGGTQVSLETKKRNFSYSGGQGAWGSFSSQQTSALTASVSGFSIAILTITDAGHFIRINGQATSSDNKASSFCDGNVGISNLNTKIGGDSATTAAALTLKMSECILYDEQLNIEEIKELEGYLAEKFCRQLADDSHPYYSDGPNCSKCESDCCESEVTTSASAASGSVVVTASYKSSESVFGYQFKLSGFGSLGMTAGLYKHGEAIPNSDSNKKFKAEFTDPRSKGFLNYISVDKTGNIWVVGHFYDSASGDFNKVLPSEASATEFVKVTISNHASAGTTQNFGSVSAALVTSNAKINTPSAPHPVLATYYLNEATRQRTPLNTYNGDSTGDGVVSMTDVEAIITRLSLSHAAGLWDLTDNSGVANSWMETLDGNGKGWLDITDAVTTLLNLKINGSRNGTTTPLTTAATVASSEVAKGLLSQIICTNKLQPTDCEPCPCPELKEPEECLSRVWIGDKFEPVQGHDHLRIITLMYQSTCCIDGYKVELGNYNVQNIGDNGTHDGVVYAPNYGNDIGQAVSETHQRNWLHGTTLDPTYTGDVALQFGEQVSSWRAASNMGSPVYMQMAQPSTLLNFPIVWGLSTANIFSAAENNNGNYINTQFNRVGYNCIPPTCDGESRILTKIVVNMSSFNGKPSIKSFRLVTNDDLATPISYNSGDGITWTGTGIDSDGVVDIDDWEEVLFYIGAGWGRTTTWADSATQTSYRNKIKVFSAEDDDSYLDIVDVLSVSNHIALFGSVASNNAAKVVPKDCCDCPVPGSFTASSTVNPCNCWDENYVSGREGFVNLSWTESSGATGYEIYRLVEPFTLADVLDTIDPTQAWKQDAHREAAKRNIVDGEVASEGQIKGILEAQFEKRIPSQWQLVAKAGPNETTWIDTNPIEYKNCCPDRRLPPVTYMVVAENDCGEVSATTSYNPVCCGHTPTAESVTIPEKNVNQTTNLFAKVYHPFAAAPHGGSNTAATAKITFTGIPANNASIKLINYKNVAYTFIFNSSGGSDNASTRTYYVNTNGLNTETVANALRDKIHGVGRSTVLISSGNAASESPGHSITITQGNTPANSTDEFTVCGNTLITVSGDSGNAITANSRFKGGNSICTQENTLGFPDACEKLTFTITNVSYTQERTSNGIFVGPEDSGGILPTGNNFTGQWQFQPPMDYIGTVTFEYTVENESGCIASSTIQVTYTPPSATLKAETGECNSLEYGIVQLSFTKPKGTLTEARILRKASPSEDGTAWNTAKDSPQIITNPDGEKAVIPLLGLGEAERQMMFKDLSVTAPDNCCSSDISYKYIIVICQTNDVVSFSEDGEQQTIGTEFCVQSTEQTIAIPCCPAPKNPIPEICSSDCDGVAAEASLVFGATQFDDVNNGTIAIINTAGTTKTYKIKNSGSPNASNQEFAAGASRAAAAENLATLIESANGHAGTIFAYDSAGKRYNDGSKDFSDGKLVLKQVVVGSAGNTTITTGANFDNTTSTNATAFRCGFSAVEHPSARVYWSAVDAADNVVKYRLYRRRKSEDNWQNIEVQILSDSTNNQNFDSITSKYFYVDSDLPSTVFCAPNVFYQYAVVSENQEGILSGNPQDADWGSGTDGVKCSVGGVTLETELAGCPPTPCLSSPDKSICIDDTQDIDLSEYTGCIPTKPTNVPVAVTYALVSKPAWLTASVSGSILSVNTRGVDLETRGIGPHEIQWSVTINDSDCAPAPIVVTSKAYITLVDCGCPCPDDEKDYTICDVNYDTAEYVAASKLLNNLQQVPFAIGREGGQNLRKGTPYMVSKGKIDCD